ncbi:MAG: hypothetical protein HQL71_01995 [Magnetococcales bacterium]|nr:hypothetical protein [Magnetococcales bacterium]
MMNSMVKKVGKKILLFSGLALGLSGCMGNSIDPTLTRMPVYEMPNAIVMQAPPIIRGPQGFTNGAIYNSVGMQPSYGAPQNNGYASYNSPQMMPQDHMATMPLQSRGYQPQPAPY